MIDTALFTKPNVDTAPLVKVLSSITPRRSIAAFTCKKVYKHEHHAEGPCTHTHVTVLSCQEKLCPTCGQKRLDGVEKQMAYYAEQTSKPWLLHVQLRFDDLTRGKLDTLAAEWRDLTMLDSGISYVDFKPEDNNGEVSWLVNFFTIGDKLVDVKRFQEQNRASLYYSKANEGKIKEWLGKTATTLTDFRDDESLKQYLTIVKSFRTTTHRGFRMPAKVGSGAKIQTVTNDDGIKMTVCSACHKPFDALHFLTTKENNDIMTGVKQYSDFKAATSVINAASRFGYPYSESIFFAAA